MLHELILVCMSIGVVTTARPLLSLANGSTSCVTDLFCKDGPADGYVCKEAGGNADVQTTVCEALNVHYNHWSKQSILLEIAFKEVDKILKAAQAGQNATSQLLVELDTLRGRQAASAALQVVQFLLFIGYLLTLSIIYVVKQCKKHRERLAEEEVELIEQKLQERKAKRRAAAAKAKAVPGPNQE